MTKERKEKLIKEGYHADIENKELLKIFSEHEKVESIGISVCSKEPNMLLALIYEYNPIFEVYDVQDIYLITQTSHTVCCVEP